jgi:hypothetical protein
MKTTFSIQLINTKRTLILAFAVFLFACSNESDPIADQSYFTRIYDNDKFNASYFPIDIKQTTDKGYLILGGRRIDESNFTGIYLLRVDAFGNFISEIEVEDLVNPVGPLLSSNGKFYFFSMTSVGLQTQLVELSETGEVGNIIDVGGSYPAAAAQDGANFLLLNYDIGSKESVMSVVNPSGGILSTKGFTIGAGDAVEEPIITHFLRTGKQLPFQVGKTASGLYFFNGFYNYTLSLVFTDLNQDNPQGVIQGQQDKGGLSYVIPTTGGKYAAAKFNFGDNYLMPAVTLNTSGVSSSTDLVGNYLPELVPDAQVKIMMANIDGQEQVLYASNTRSRQIALFSYSPSDGKLLGSRYLGFSNPFEVAAMITTEDKGLIICGTTYLAGRFPRICLFKLSAEELAKSF